MLTLAAVLTFHATALAAVLVSARKAVLVDEQGQPITPAWQESVVPAARALTRR